jgi:hypothetical protein
MRNFVLRIFVLALSVTWAQNLVASHDEQALVPLTIRLQDINIKPIAPKAFQVESTFGKVTKDHKDQWLDKHIQTKILSYLDPVSTARAMRVCSHWNNLITAEIGRVRTAWLNGNRSGEILRSHGFHILTLLHLMEDIAMEGPLTGIEYSDDKKASETPSSMVADFVHMASRSPQISRMLGRYTLALDPARDFRKVCLMASVLKENQSVQTQLSSLLTREQNPFGEQGNDHDIQFIAKLKNREQMATFLMAAKLMALSGDRPARDLLLQFAETLNLYMHEQYKAHVLQSPDEPLWVCYTDHKDVLQSYTELLASLNGEPNHRDCLQRSPALAEYVKRMHPADKPLQANMQIVWNACCKYAAWTGNEEDCLIAENMILETTNPADFFQVVTACYSALNISELQAIFGKAPLVWSIYMRVQVMLDNLLIGEGPGSGVRFYVNKQKVDLILNYHDVDRFDDAETAIGEMLPWFNAENPGYDLAFDNNGREVIKQINDFDVMSFRAALAIYRGQFETAVADLKDITHFRPALLLAMKSQVNNDDIPGDLIQRLGDIVAFTIDELVNSSELHHKGTAKAFTLIFDDAFMDRYLGYHPHTRSQLDKWIKR